MRTNWIALMLLTAPLAGCFMPGFDGPRDTADAHAPVLVMDLPIHVVTVGFEQFDSERLLEYMEPNHPSINWGRAVVTGAVDHEPLQYDIEYVVHEAPDAFAQSLFGHMGSIAKPTAPDSFLENYDRDGRHRICTDQEPLLPLALPEVGLVDEPCDDVQQVDAFAVEEWIANNRAEHGLVFPGAGYTVFVLDHHTKAYLSTDTYHQFTLGKWESGDRPLRAWGGTHDFVFLDVSAGPNPRDYRPWAHWSREGYEQLGPDEPIWDIQGDPDTFYANLARHLRDAVNLLWAHGPIYALEHADRYVLPFYIMVDPNTRTNPDSPLNHVDPADIPANTDEELVAQAIRNLVPWAEVDVEFHYVYLPDDDPGMHEALQDAKTRHMPGSVDYGVIRRHIDDNWQDYVMERQGEKTFPTFAFWLEFPSPYRFAGADATEWGDAWGVIANIGDASLCQRPGVPVCTPEDRPGQTEEAWWRWWNFLLIHEIGHSFGLHHPFNAIGLDDEDYTTIDINRLWDSTATAMTYRHTHPSFSAFNQDWILRHHAVHLAADVLADPDATSVALEAAESALDAVQAGDYKGALEAARQAREAIGETGVYRPPDVGPTMRGVTETITVETAAGSSIGVPQTGLPGLPWSVELPTGELSYERFSVEIPNDAVALELAYRETDAPSHAGWAAWVDIHNNEDESVAGLWSNAEDRIIFRALDRCDSGCTGYLYGYGGAAMTHEVSLTPLFPAEKEV